jgi:hypothetical protein
VPLGISASRPAMGVPMKWENQGFETQKGFIPVPAYDVYPTQAAALSEPPLSHL